MDDMACNFNDEANNEDGFVSTQTSVVCQRGGLVSMPT